MKKLFIVAVLISSSSFTFGQGTDEDYISEFIYGLNINTNGGFIGGVFFKTTKIVKPKVYRSLGIEIVGIKNNKEVRTQSVRTGNTFIPGKRNYLYSFRFQYGRDYVLFRKAPEEGVLVTATFAAGPSLGLQIPYHILYNFDGELRSEQYDPTVHTSFGDIFQAGGFLEGIGNTEFLFGAHIKAGISLDFGTFRNSITGVEAGFTLEVFHKTAELLAPVSFQSGGNLPEIPTNRSVFPGAYLSIFFGTRK